MSVVNLLVFINNSKSTLLQKNSKPLLSLLGGGLVQGRRENLIEPISMSKSLTVEEFLPQDIWEHYSLKIRL